MDHKKHENDEAVVGNDLSSSTDREAARRERRAERRKAKEEAEAKAADESPSVEGAAAAAEPEKETPKRSLKKVGKGENSGRKRQAKKNLREKRRSTGVVIMPNMDVSFENIFLVSFTLDISLACFLVRLDWKMQSELRSLYGLLVLNFNVAKNPRCLPFNAND